MFQSLTERIGQALRRIRGTDRLTEKNIAQTLDEVRTALLSADVHFRVVRQFIERVQEQCLGQAVLRSVSPGEMAVKIIHEELTCLLGESASALVDKKNLRLLMIGLHGAGKTTTAAKLASFLKKQGKVPLLVACDIYRPAAIDQLQILAEQENCLCFAQRDSKNVTTIAKNALTFAKQHQADSVIFDTAGRLQMDTPLIDELKALKHAVLPDEILLVADSATGQQAVNIAQSFNDALCLTGVILTKLDGDARAGAALSMKSVTQVPVKFVGTGEKISDFDRFYPDRLAQRILGMGDIVSLVEMAEEKLDKEKGEALTKKILQGNFSLEDMLSQIRQVKKIGSMRKIAQLLPGVGNMPIGEEQETQMKRTEALLLSMTPRERQQPYLLNASRRRRIAQGAGLSIRELNTLLKQFSQMQRLVRRKKGRKLLSSLGNPMKV